MANIFWLYCFHEDAAKMQRLSDSEGISVSVWVWDFQFHMEFETKEKDENNNSFLFKIKSPKLGSGGSIHWHSVDWIKSPSMFGFSQGMMIKGHSDKF